MKLRQLVDELSLKTYCADENNLDAEVPTAYCGDLLSDVMAHVPQGAVWFTVLAHLNIIAVAQLRDVACIVIVNGSEPDKQTLGKAADHRIAVFGSTENSAQLCMKIAGKL
ncbi:MAG TPA: hypothetical protein DET40_03785 [Lentisphaeria bacterium]|nr:MAG: hypothetical protein A2X45_23625 [Lentisphaerae bacterium GWF2_50_93]HCE42649.1 hypothetical protein [Lentisphaeria bacterium]